MASTKGTSSEVTNEASTVSSVERSDNRVSSSRGQRGGRGGFGHPQSNGPMAERIRGNRRGGRGDRGKRTGGDPTSRHRGVPNDINNLAPPIPPPPGLGGGGTFGDRLTKDAETNEGEGKAEKQSTTEDDRETELCFICASSVVHTSVGPCNHRTCHICALRLRALYKNRACAHCRTEADYVIFTDNPTKRYEEFADGSFEEVDETLGIKYEQKEIHADTVILLRYNCPDVDCDIACWGWPNLHRHVKSTHHKVMCDLCTRNKKVFTHEHELFTMPELRKHEKFGDDNPGAVDQSGFKGHPECGFCRERFYGDDELYTHCRDKHERCHICDRRQQGRQQQYYVDYNSLEQHFRKDHFLCADQECMDKKFVVFDSEMDLKAHQLEVHPNGLSKDARRDARLVNISTFDYRAPYQDVRGGRQQREGRGRGRGRDPNSEPLPQSTAQPLRRDELAYQRQMEVQSAQSVSTRTFGGQLTSSDVYGARPNSTAQQATVTAPATQTSTNPSFPAIDNLRLESLPNASSQPPSTSLPTQNLTPQEQARRLRHASVMDRASTLLQNDLSKLNSFRTAVSSYRTSQLTATQLLDTFFSLFDVPSSSLSTLIKELAEIYETDTKRADLLKAWNDWRAINEDYPSLPGPSGILPGSSTASAGSGGRRVLKLKSSTAQSSRSAVSRHGSWNNAANTTPFPPMPAPISANRPGAGRVGATPWVSSQVSSSRPTPVSSRPSSRGAVRAVPTDAFPALPVGKKPNTAIWGMTKGTVRWDEGKGTTNANPWGGVNGASSGGSAVVAASEAVGEGEGAGGKRKGGKGKKQTLYRFG